MFGFSFGLQQILVLPKIWSIPFGHLDSTLWLGAELWSWSPSGAWGLVAKLRASSKEARFVLRELNKAKRREKDSKGKKHYHSFPAEGIFSGGLHCIFAVY